VGVSPAVFFAQKKKRNLTNFFFVDLETRVTICNSALEKMALLNGVSG
jgi:hypothetical protein